MLINKIRITDALREFIINEREATKLTAADVSEKIGRTKSWLSQLENGRLQNINRIDLINIFVVLKNISEPAAEQYIEDFMNSVNDNTGTQQVSLFKVEDELNDLQNEFDEIIGDINTIYKVLFNNINDKNDAIKISKRIRSNMKSGDLGYILSLYALPWCKLTSLEHRDKSNIINDIFNIIKKNGIDCNECKKNEKKVKC